MSGLLSSPGGSSASCALASDRLPAHCADVPALLRRLPAGALAVTTIAALGLNLTLGYAGQISLRRAPSSATAYTVAIMTGAGVP